MKTKIAFIASTHYLTFNYFVFGSLTGRSHQQATTEILRNIKGSQFNLNNELHSMRIHEAINTY